MGGGFGGEAGQHLSSGRRSGLVDGKPPAGVEPKDLGDSSQDGGSCKGPGEE